MFAIREPPPRSAAAEVDGRALARICAYSSVSTCRRTVARFGRSGTSLAIDLPMSRINSLLLRKYSLLWLEGSVIFGEWGKCSTLAGEAGDRVGVAVSPDI